MERVLTCNVIDGNLNFDSRSLSEVSRQFSNSFLPVVSIIGSQSSGKSSFLNEAFGLDLAVMNPEMHQQTTKGILLSKPRNRDLVILDCEGYDGLEREAQGQNFVENMLGLFALCISDVIIINLFTQDVNRSRGSFNDLLSIIIQNYIKIVRDKRKRTILFLLRDFDLRGNLDKYHERISNSFESIWNTHSQSTQNASYIDFFEIKTCKLFWNPLERVNNPDDIAAVSAEILKSTDAYSRVVISSRLWGTYWNELWTNIQMSKEKLDILSLKERMEMKYCEETSQRVYENVYQELLAKLKNIDQIINLKKLRNKSMKLAVDMYSDYCGRIQMKIFEQYKTELGEKLEKEFAFFELQNKAISEMISYKTKLKKVEDEHQKETEQTRQITKKIEDEAKKLETDLKNQLNQAKQREETALQEAKRTKQEAENKEREALRLQEIARENQIRAEEYIRQEKLNLERLQYERERAMISSQSSQSTTHVSYNTRNIVQYVPSSSYSSASRSGGKFYKGGQFIPGGGRAPKGGTWM